MLGTLSAKEVAQQLQVSEAWVTTHARGAARPELKGMKIGKLWRFEQEDVDQLKRECRQFAELYAKRRKAGTS